MNFSTKMTGQTRAQARALLTGLALSAASVLVACGQSDNEAGGGAEVLWDKWGVPHIYATTEQDADYAFGRAQMTNHANLLLELYGTSRGRAAEYWGPSHLDSDKFVHQMGLPERAPALLEAQGPEYIARLEAFVKGMNDWAAENPGAINEANQQVLPIRPEDVLAQTQRSLHLTFITWSIGEQIAGWKKQGEIQGEKPDGEQGEKQGDQPGSNAWAIAPSRSESGNAMLLMNPHLPWQGLFLFFEAHINAPGYDGYGVGLIGMPFMAIVFNKDLGWTHTVNTYDGADTYELELAANRADGDDGYMIDGEVRAFEEHSVTLKVRGDDGTLISQTLIIKNSIHGPVIGERNGKALTLKIAGLTEPGHNRLFEQYWRLGSASNLDEFESALSMLQMPMFNTIYADRHGDIFYAFNALQPVRSEGDVAFWGGIIDGTRSDLHWSGYRAYEELPKYRNPPSGFVQNANDPPWTSTFPQALKAADFPPDMAPQRMEFRPQHSASMLLADESISYQELLEYRQSSRLVLADKVLDELIAAARKSGDQSAIDGAEILTAWDRETNPDSRGAVLFMMWARTVGLNAIFEGDLFRDTWSPDEPLATPRGLADSEAAAKALATAVDSARSTYGAADVPWGDVVRVRYAGQDLPASVGPGELGSFRVGFIGEIGDPGRAGDDGIVPVAGGNSFVAAVEFGAQVHARGILGPGNATEAATGHFGDQLQLHAAGEFRDILFTRNDVEAGAVRREKVRYSKDK